MKTSRRIASSGACVVSAAMACALMAGCGTNGTVEVKANPAVVRLKAFVTAYMEASVSLKHPPRNAAELTPFLSKHGDPKQLLTSPTDGSDLIVHWGTDLAKIRPQGEQWPVWVYESNSHRGKRWVLQWRRPFEVTDEQLRKSVFVPGFKSPL